jgi:hypothetical protein
MIVSPLDSKSDLLGFRRSIIIDTTLYPAEDVGRGQDGLGGETSSQLICPERLPIHRGPVSHRAAIGEQNQLGAAMVWVGSIADQPIIHHVIDHTLN